MVSATLLLKIAIVSLDIVCGVLAGVRVLDETAARRGIV